LIQGSAVVIIVSPGGTGKLQKILLAGWRNTRRLVMGQDKLGSD
jgi:hypothetical protein